MRHPIIRKLAAALCVAPASITAAQGSPDFYRGLPHLPLGDATLETTGCSDCLIVSNIGSSGDDGVCVDPGETADDVEITVDVGPSGALTPGFLFKLKEHPRSAPPAPDGGGGALPLSMTLSETGGGEASLGADFDYFNPPGARVELLLDGAVVSSVDLTSPFPSSLLTGNLGTVGADGYLVIDNGFAVPAAAGEGPYLRIKMSRVIISSLGAGTGGGASAAGPLVADEIRIIMTGLPTGATRPTVGAVEMQAANVSQFSLHDERLVKFGNPHRALGVAQQQASRDDLVISNIGASGDDGARVDFAPASRFDITIPVIPTGETIALNFMKIGSEQGDPGNEIQSALHMTGIAGGGALLMETDFSDLGSLSRHVDVLAGGVVIGSVLGQAGAVGETTDNPECIIWDIKDSCEAAPGEHNLELHLAWPAPVSMTITGLGPFSADGLRIVPEASAVRGGDPDQPLVVGRVYGASVTASGIASLDITGETVTPLPACASDTNDDGVVNVLDLLDLLAAWGGSDPLFDIAPAGGDGVVNVLDLLKLLAEWGPCAIDK